MYGIHRIEKRTRNDVLGLQLEANRTLKDHLKGREFPGSSIDWQKTDENIFLIKCDNWNAEISRVLKEHNIKPRKNSIVMLDAIYTASPEFFEDKSKEEIIAYFKSCLEFHKATYGDNIFSCCIHLDESTPHCHISSLPLLLKSGGEVCLSARDLMGSKNDYRERQNSFYEQVTSLWGLERGELKDHAEKRRHISKLEYEEQQALLRAEKAKAEANIRERVLEACSEPMPDIKTTKSLIPGKIMVDSKDLEKLQSQVATSRHLESSLNKLEKYAKQNMDVLKTNEHIINANNQIDELKKILQEQNQSFSQERATLNRTIEEQSQTLNDLNSYIQRIEDFLHTLIEWLKGRRLYKEFEAFLHTRNQEPEELELEEPEEELELELELK